MKLGRRVRRTRQGDFELKLPTAERDLLRSLPGQLQELLDTPDTGDLRRLFPPAYVDDRDGEREYRQLMHEDLVDGHRRALETMAATVDATRLDEEQLTGWLGSLNDLRLVLGTRLDVSEDQAPLARDDPRAPAMALYGYLTWLQQQVVEALAEGL